MTIAVRICKHCTWLGFRATLLTCFMKTCKPAVPDCALKDGKLVVLSVYVETFIIMRTHTQATCPVVVTTKQRCSVEKQGLK